jgi:hypothetical protein
MYLGTPRIIVDPILFYKSYCCNIEKGIEHAKPFGIGHSIE